MDLPDVAFLLVLIYIYVRTLAPGKRMVDARHCSVHSSNCYFMFRGYCRNYYQTTKGKGEEYVTVPC